MKSNNKTTCCFSVQAIIMYLISSLSQSSHQHPSAQSLTNGWTKWGATPIQCGIYTLAIKKNEIWMHAATWMNLEDLYEVKEGSPKAWHAVWFHFHDMSRTGKSVEMDCRLAVAQSWGNWKGNGKPLLGVQGFFLGWHKGLKLIGWLMAA